ncbi:MAG: hypothetical protein LBB45_08450 [Methanobrevibacter sp.]|jgi:hypothetical protein|nr:hypothetical protein [Candidatus Methanovirga basalitermitum]
MEIELQSEDKHGKKIISVTDPIVTPWQTLKDKIRLCLVYVPRNCYYWLIDNFKHDNKDYKSITLDTEPEKLENSDDVINSSLYKILRMSIVNHLNNLDIEDLRYRAELDPDEDLTEDIFYKHVGYINEVLYSYEKNCINELESEVSEFKDIIKDGREFIGNEDKKDLIKNLQSNYSKRANIGKSNLDLSFILTDYLKIGKHYITELIYKLDENSMVIVVLALMMYIIQLMT